MAKMISITTLLLLACLTVNAQDNDDNDDLTTTPPVDSSTVSPTNTNTITNGATGTPVTNDTSVTTPNMGVTTTTPSTDTSVSTPVTVTTPVTDGSATGTMTTTTSTTMSTAPTTFNCIGSGPNWNLSIGKSLMTYSSSQDTAVKIRGVVPLSPMGDTSGSSQIYQAKSAAGKPVTILVRKNATGCAAGLTGQAYQYDAFVIFPNVVVAGCCNPA